MSGLTSIFSDCTQSFYRSHQSINIAEKPSLASLACVSYLSLLTTLIKPSSEKQVRAPWYCTYYFLRLTNLRPLARSISCLPFIPPPFASFFPLPPRPSPIPVGACPECNSRNAALITFNLFLLPHTFALISFIPAARNIRCR